MTTSLRGNVIGDLSVSLIHEGVHSGNASGIVPSSFSVLRDLLDRVEDPKTAHILLDSLHVEIPEARREQAQLAANVLNDEIAHAFPFINKVEPINATHDELILNRTWRPGLEVTGADGLPALKDAGNVMRPNTTVRLSMRIPPTCDPIEAGQALKTCLEKNPPYGAEVAFHLDEEACGWHAPLMDEWLMSAAEVASQTHFGKSAVYMGEGGTIPFMGMLGEKFPKAQFVITGVLGPHSNAHGPNEFLHIPTAKRLTACVADLLAAHCEQMKKVK